MSNAPACKGCGKTIAMGERFSAKRDESGVWTVMHDTEIFPSDELFDLPRFVMTQARLWVLTK